MIVKGNGGPASLRDLVPPYTCCSAVTNSASASRCPAARIGRSPRSLADDRVEDGREEQAEEGHADHAVEHDGAQRVPHFRSRRPWRTAAATRRK